MNSDLPESSSASTREAQLEQLIAQACKAQPLVQAPTGLQARVMAEAQRRAQLPWWHKSFVHWPVAASIAWLLASLLAAQLLVMLLAHLNTHAYTEQLIGAVAEPLSWLQIVSRLVTLLLHSVALVMVSLPRVLLLAGIVVIAAYGAVFALSAAVYRTLYVQR